MYYPHNYAPAAVATGDDAFALCFHIPSVVLIYGNTRRMHADEHTHSARLMRTLDWLGREGIELRGAICGGLVLDRSSVRALNLYLRHGNGLTAFRRVAQNGWRHKYAWQELQQLLALRWIT